MHRQEVHTFILAHIYTQRHIHAHTRPHVRTHNTYSRTHAHTHTHSHTQRIGEPPFRTVTTNRQEMRGQRMRSNGLGYTLVYMLTYTAPLHKSSHIHTHEHIHKSSHAHTHTHTHIYIHAQTHTHTASVVVHEEADVHWYHQATHGPTQAHTR
eukprot:GHVU01096328.1.p3 GENE.GHVU01096328.1~~GHVU01096328.1.p3  ORF type:complete len:153 (-),score=7.61 GHVU01096328.1:710-1168(-)